MTTYTITQGQVDLLTGVLERACTTDDGEYKWDTHSKAIKMVQSLTPNNGEPIGYAYEHQDFIGSVIGAKGEWAPNEVALFTHPAVPSTSPVTTGWDTGLMQDYDKGLSRALSEKLDAREVVRSVFPDTAPSTSPLTDDQMWALWNSHGSDEMNQREAIAFARAIEAVHGIALPPPAK